MKQKNKKTGFSLIEVLVATTVFVLVVSVAAGLFVHTLQSQRKVLAYQELFDQTSYIMEYMTRSIRMAKKQRTTIDPPITCIDPIGRNYQLIGLEGRHLRFIRWDHLVVPGGAFICYEFRLNVERIEVSRDRGTSWTFLTSDRLRILNLRFIVEGDNPGLQPRITILLEAEGREYGLGMRPKTRLQTTISQRDLNF